MDENVRRAQEYATTAHARIDHQRKYSGQPYDVHLRAVAELVSTVTDDPDAIAAAWLHDVVEDTPATFLDLEEEFGATISRLVAELTDVSRPRDGNRAARKAIDREHLAAASPHGQTIKLADLIDNCRDICKHDSKFARTYLLEMHALLGVLVDGDSTLRKRAKRMVEQGANELGVELAERRDDDVGAGANAAFRSDPSQHRWWRLFSSVFSARDLAEPVRSFDGARDAQEVLERICALGIELVGVRRDGEVDSFVRQADLGEGRCEDFARPLARDQIINEDASLSEVIHVLTKYPVGFVDHLGAVVGFVTRADIQKPLVRMWLFGVITMIEMTIVARIRARWSRPEWIALVPPKRLEKAQQLLDERERRGHQEDLLDCLQLSDKAQLLIQHPEELAAFDFSSKKQARKAIKEFESLRNNLAHAQDIVTHDWAQIARLTSRVEEIAGLA